MAVDEEVSSPPLSGKLGGAVLWQYGQGFAVAIILAVLLRVFVVEAYKIPSGSMIPTLRIGDHILVNKFIFYFTKPRRGDIIVFKFPQDPKRNFIKRVIGLPGESLQILNKKILINGELLREDYIYIETNFYQGAESNRDTLGPVTIPPGMYFMMGDNRDSSHDSRFWGPLDEKKILGKAFMVYWSWNRQAHGLQRIRWKRLGRGLH